MTKLFLGSNVALNRIPPGPHYIALVVLVIGLFPAQTEAVSATADGPPPKCANATEWSEIGSKAADYKGDTLPTVSPNGADGQLRCLAQRLEGQASTEGLWLMSTVTNAMSERFRVVASSVGRNPQEMEALSCTGKVSIDNQTVRFIRPGVVEEYSVSMDGVRQDFVIKAKPSGEGELRVELAVAGAQIEMTRNGVQLVLEKSGRKVTYSRLHVTDASGKQLPARMKVQKRSGFWLTVVVEDAQALYPICIDPTFSDANWISMGNHPGADGPVNATVVDGLGNLYIAGAFTKVGDVAANGVAKWDGSTWSALGSGISGDVRALAVSGSNLYAGGKFTTAGGNPASSVAKWDGSSWSALGSGVSGQFSFYTPVYALAASGSDLYAGGTFTSAGGNPANSIAKWDGSSWSALGSGVSRDDSSLPTVYALAVSGADVFAAGAFTIAGGNPANLVARWDGTSWSGLGSGMSVGFLSAVYALVLSGSELYAGGHFATPGASATNCCVAKLEGSTWTTVGLGVGGGAGGNAPTVYALAVLGSNIYAAGDLFMAGGNFANYIAKWDGSKWSGMGSGMDDYVYSLAASSNKLYAGGKFPTAGGGPVNNVAQWDGSKWSPTSPALDLFVSALAVSGSNLYVGGAFTWVDGFAVNRIAKRDGNSWSPLGSGMDNEVYVLAAAGSNLYAGGVFTNVDGKAANYIAHWNGSAWNALGSGIGKIDLRVPKVNALAISGNNLFVGGHFKQAGGNSANYIAKWDGSTWSALGSGMNEEVWALAVSGSDLYVGGNFTVAGGIQGMNKVAKWDGTNWSTLGSGFDQVVYALAISGSDLYAGGRLTSTTLQGNPNFLILNRISRWNGSSWNPLSSGVNDDVLDLAVSGDELYAAGSFTTAGGNPANHIAKWNGNSWSSLGSGTGGGSVSALAVSGNDLYAGGSFSTAGGKPSVYVARAYLERPALSMVRSGGDVTLSWPTFYESFLLQQNMDMANTNTWTDGNYSLATNVATKSVTFPTSGTNQFFRLIER